MYMEVNLTAMNPYGNWFCRRKEHCDNTPVKRSVPSLLRLDSTGNTCCEKGLNSSIQKSMASCIAKTFSGMTSRSNSRSPDNIVGCVSDYPILQNSFDSACDKNMAAKNCAIMHMRPETSCIGSFQSLAGCKGMNTSSSISQHPGLHQSKFQIPYLQFHPAVFSAHPQQSDSAKKQVTKCQSQRTGKKSNRYFRYGWNAPQRKQSPEGIKSGTPKKSENTTVPKKQKCESKECDKQVEKKISNSEHCDRKNDKKQKTDNESKDILSSPLSNLSLGESVAIKNALNQCSMSSSASNDIEKPKPDWFSIGRRDSESKLSPSNTVIVLDNWDDEISEEFQSENIKLQNDMIDLLATEEEKTNSLEDNIISTETSKSNSFQNVEKICDTLCTDEKVPDESKSQENVADTNAVVTQMCQNSEPHAVLYQRNMNKKGRPSHKKRSRKKGSKHSKSNNIEQGQKRKFEDSTSSKSGACTIAFIIGGSDPHSSLDSESDFSFDSDEDSSDSVDDDIDFVCHFTERLLVNSAPLLMNIICSAKSSPVSQAVSAANREWETMSEKPSTTATQSDRKVHFAEPESLTETYIADDWNRKGPWEEYARDRERFKRRIEEVKGVIDPILCEDHRQHVYSNLMHQTE